MKIAALGTPNRLEELKKRLPSTSEFIEVKNKNFTQADVIIDLNFDDYPEHINDYTDLAGKLVIVGAVKHQLEQVVAQCLSPLKCHLIGMNTLPSFIDREIMEVTAIKNNDKEVFQRFVTDWNWKYEWVKSRVGMVTPRVIFMIINEAFYTLQEGTASRKDIDLGMKLGTAYPFGPFEWCDKIGVKNVYEVLDALYLDTKEPRYKICPLLKSEYYSTKLKI
ncbi:MAG: 3-hydroxyacyl-CoA dehydrogenase [Bacteroidetes bacterium]|nr:3-hydroxyacyl-CoA dehydrogenase [Bacteroidota bacterium]